jgi:hypothetical protein
MAINRQILDANYNRYDQDRPFDWDIFESVVRHISEEFDEVFNAAIDVKTGCPKGEELVRQVKLLSGRFFKAWSRSSWKIVGFLGADRAFAILEKLSLARHATWDCDSFHNFSCLYDKLKVYRGGGGSKEEVLKGYSWTVDLDDAIIFAERYSDGIVLSAELDRKDVVLVFWGQLEVVPRLNSLKNVKVFENHNRVVKPSITYDFARFN